MRNLHTKQYVRPRKTLYLLILYLVAKSFGQFRIETSQFKKRLHSQITRTSWPYIPPNYRRKKQVVIL